MTTNRMGLNMDRKCSKHPQIELQVHPFNMTASQPPQTCYYCPECEPGVKQCADWEKDRINQLMGNSDVHKTHKIYITPSDQSALSDEELTQIVSGCVDGVYPTSQEVSMARELLAYRKASKEVYGYVNKAVFEMTGSVGLFNDHEHCADSPSYIPLYAAPPLQAVTVPDGWQLVPIEPTYEMSKAIGLPWEFPPFPLRWKRILEAAPKAGSDG